MCAVYRKLLLFLPRVVTEILSFLSDYFEVGSADSVAIANAFFLFFLEFSYSKPFFYFEFAIRS